MDSPRYYTGTRLDVAALNSDVETLAYFADHGMRPAAYPIVDLPFSVIADTAALPYLLLCVPARPRCFGFIHRGG